jgi:hypothetical protein
MLNLTVLLVLSIVNRGLEVQYLAREFKLDNITIYLIKF